MRRETKAPKKEFVCALALNESISSNQKVAIDTDYRLFYQSTAFLDFSFITPAVWRIRFPGKELGFLLRNIYISILFFKPKWRE